MAYQLNFEIYQQNFGDLEQIKKYWDPSKRFDCYYGTAPSHCRYYTSLYKDEILDEYEENTSYTKLKDLKDTSGFLAENNIKGDKSELDLTVESEGQIRLSPIRQ